MKVIVSGECSCRRCGGTSVAAWRRSTPVSMFDFLTSTWSAGVPTLALAVRAFRGQSQSVEFGKAYAFTETLAPGQVYNYRFDTSEIKKPLHEAVTSCGWTWKGVAFGKL